MLKSWSHAPFQSDDEQGRLAALRRYEVLDSSPEAPFDDLVSIARTLAQTPMAYISLVDEDRQWFKARLGTDVHETERDIAFCDHAIRQEDVTVILDAREDPRFCENPMVTGDPFVRFYAGAPIITPDGYAVGTICLVDHEPREGFEHAGALAALARQASALLELRKTIITNEEAAEIAADQRDRLWDSSLDMMLIARTNGDLVAGNPAWEKAFGPVPEVSLSGQSPNISDFFADSSAANLIEFGSEQKTLNVEREMRAANGEMLYTSWTLAREDDMIFGIARDLTPVREAEAKLAHVQRMESIGQLTGGIAHDFNNLLTIILGNLDMASRRISGHNVEGEQIGKVEQAISNARDGAKRAANLTQRLLAFARRQPLSPTTVQPLDLINDLRPLARQALDERFSLNFDCGDDIWPIKIDSAQLENAILNLVVNARDAMEETGNVNIMVANHHISDRDAQKLTDDAKAGAYVKIAVEDNGSGISKEIADRIFEPFFTTKEINKGTGLGLSQVQGFVVQSGGFVTIDSMVGRGTTVSLWLPRTEPAEGSGAHVLAGDAPVQSLRGAGNILLVEDNEELRYHVAEILADEGFDVTQAPGGKEAAQMLAENPRLKPALMLSDIMMPEIDGHRLAKLARAKFPSMPIILMTGYAGGDMPADSPHDALLMKPFSPDELVHEVQTQLNCKAGRTVT